MDSSRTASLNCEVDGLRCLMGCRLNREFLNSSFEVPGSAIVRPECEGLLPRLKACEVLRTKFALPPVTLVRNVS
jgi:hypothetical protein